MKQRENIAVQVVLGYILAFFNFMLLFNPEIFQAVFYSFKYQWLLYLSSIIVAIFGIIPYGYLAKAIERHNLFSFLGRNSMYIFALHLPIMYTVTTAFRKFVLHANNIFIPNEYNALGITIYSIDYRLYCSLDIPYR